MSLLSGLGAFGKGAIGGYEAGLNLQEKIAKIKQNRAREAAIKAGTAKFNEVLSIEDANKENAVQIPQEQQDNSQDNMKFSLGIDQLADTSSGEYSLGLSDLANVKGYVDGGIVRKNAPQVSSPIDQNSIVTQAQQPVGLSALQPKQQTQQEIPQQAIQEQPMQRARNPLEIASKLRGAYYEAAKAARAAGSDEVALEYGKLGFAEEDKIHAHKSKQAQAFFDTTGNLQPLIDIYNDDIPDGYHVVGHQRTDNGYKLQIKSPDGTVQEQEMTPDEIRANIAQYQDPSTRFATRMKALADEASDKRKRANEIGLENIKSQNELDKEILKGNIDLAKENNSIKSFGLDSVALKGDKVIYDGSQRTKSDGWKDNFQNVNGGYLQKDANGNVQFVQTKEDKGDGLDVQTVTEEPAFDVMGDPIIDKNTGLPATTRKVVRKERVVKQENKATSTEFQKYKDAIAKYPTGHPAREKIYQYFKQKGIVK